MNFVRNDDEVFVHNAPNQQWDYLFQDTSGQQVISGIFQTQTEEIYSWIISTGIQTIATPTTGLLDCITPRGETVKNNDFVLGYEERSDVNTICNIQKRICSNGVLWGTFSQQSCQENAIYDYTKAPVISYNQKILNDYIQPTTPINVWAAFNNEGKINSQEQPTDVQGTSNWSVTTTPQVAQSPWPTQVNCTTPRGQKIKNGQFVKAYKAPRGFIDLPCNVEIRACVNGKMKGSYTNAGCKYNNTTYTDYLKAGSPSSNTWFLFFQRIKSALKR